MGQYVSACRHNESFAATAEGRHSGELTTDSTPIDAGRARILICVIGTEPDAPMVEIFQRFPVHLLRNPSVDILYIDDATASNTAARLTSWLDSHAIDSVRVLRTPERQGYGGSRKLACTLALTENYDFLLVFPGDGSCPPEVLPQVIETWRRTGAAVVLVTSEPLRAGHRPHGLSLPGYLCMRSANWLPNRLTGLKLPELQSGCRGYSAALLSEVKFALNTNERHFDAEILLQAVQIGAQITESLACGQRNEGIHDRIGLKDAWHGLTTAVGFKLHEMGIFCSLKYRRADGKRYCDKTHIPYSSHRMALEQLLALNPRRVLDVGCGSGHVAAQCQQRGIQVTGIDCGNRPDYELAEFFQLDLEKDPFPVDLGDFDAVLLLDVIEHLSEPEQFLLDLRNNHLSWSRKHRVPVVILSTPNVAFIGVRLNLLFGRFTYAERGILDITHRRLFTRRSLVSALRQSGYRIQRIVPVPPPFERVIGGHSGRLLGWFGKTLALCWPKGFAFQFLVVCEPMLGIDEVLAHSEPGLKPPREAGGRR